MPGGSRALEVPARSARESTAYMLVELTGGKSRSALAGENPSANAAIGRRSLEDST